MPTTGPRSRDEPTVQKCVIYEPRTLLLLRQPLYTAPRPNSGRPNSKQSWRSVTLSINIKTESTAAPRLSTVLTKPDCWLGEGCVCVCGANLNSRVKRTAVSFLFCRFIIQLENRFHCCHRARFTQFQRTGKSGRVRMPLSSPTAKAHHQSAREGCRDSGHLCGRHSRRRPR